jgi:heme-degrading monooxygenase HmoA
MALVSVTRLRLRSPRYLLPFLWHALLTTRQANHAPGNLGSVTRVSGGLVFWTMTLWQDEAAMKDYRNSGAHLKVMPKLRQWCDQSATARWQQDQAIFPSWQEAEQRLAALSTNAWQRQTV